MQYSSARTCTCTYTRKRREVRCFPRVDLLCGPSTLTIRRAPRTRTWCGGWDEAAEFFQKTFPSSVISLFLPDLSDQWCCDVLLLNNKGLACTKNYLQADYQPQQATYYPYGRSTRGPQCTRVACSRARVEWEQTGADTTYGCSLVAPPPSLPRSFINSLIIHSFVRSFTGIDTVVVLERWNSLRKEQTERNNTSGGGKRGAAYYVSE